MSYTRVLRGSEWCWGVILFFALLSASHAQDASLKQTPAIGAIAGTSHVLWLKPDGSVYAAAECNDGARGDRNDDEYRFEFTRLQGLEKIVQIQTTEDSSAALSADGTVWVWGRFAFLEPRHQPKQIPDLKNVTQIALGSNFLVALLQDGSVVVAGDAEYGLRGNDPNALRKPFTVIAVGNDNVSVAATLNTAFAVKKDGSVWGWGSRFGALLGSTSQWSFLDREQDPTPKPIAVSGLSNIVSVEGGHHHALALDRNGRVFAWGDNEDGALGFPKRMGFGETYYQYPAMCQGLPKIVQVSAGYGYSMALDSDGKVWTWGDNIYGALGVFEEFDEGRLTPKQVANVSSAQFIFAGDYQAYAVLKDASVMGWGSNTPNGSILSKTIRTEFVQPVVFLKP